MTANPVIIRYLPWWFSVLAALGAAAFTALVELAKANVPSQAAASDAA